MQYKKLVHIRITSVPDDVDRLYQMCELANVPYRGENITAVAQSIFLRSLSKPRNTFSDVAKKEIRERQKGLCVGCGEELGTDAELDHVKALAKWGKDDISNVEFKCRLCHLEKTEQERLGGNLRTNPLAFTMSRDLLEQFVMAPKPPQLMVGKVKEGDLGLDVDLCRTTALVNNYEPLPKFSLLDKPEPYVPGQEYDFYYSDAGSMRSSEKLYERLPYTGLGW